MDTVTAELPRFRLDAPSALGSSLDGPGEISSGGIRADRRIALALCEAQVVRRSPVVPARDQVQTLDEILELARGRGWNQVFRMLKSQGLLEEQTLGQVVARWNTRDRGADSFMSPPRADLRIAPSPAPSQIA
jgi:hypothetical protein